MKQTKTWGFMALAALMGGLTACSEKEEVGYPSSGEVKNVALKISSSSATRAATTPISDATTVSFNHGYIYFVSKGSYDIRHRVEIIETGSAEKDASGKTTVVVLDALEDGTVIENVPVEKGDYIFIVANTDKVASMVGGNFKQVEDAVLSLAGEADYDASNQLTGGIKNVTLFGRGELDEPVGTEDAFTYTVQVDVKPAVTARIEVPRVFADGDIESFTLAGIYIGQTYRSVSIKGSAQGSMLGTETEGDDLIAEYNASDAGLLFDAMSINSEDNSGDCTPGTGKTWAYNVFTYNDAYNQSDVTNPIGGAPSVVFVIKNVKAKASSEVYFDEDDTFYITVQGFISGGQEIDQLEAGHIYRLTSGIKVNGETLTDKPNVKRVNVEVEISLADWVIENVDPRI